LEGYLIFRALVIVFPSNEHRRWPFLLAAYGLPLLIAGATLIASLPGPVEYHRFDACWLNFPYEWGFLAPVILVTVLNTGVMVKSLMIASKVSGVRGS
jgi:hypothetical protein